VKPEYGTVSTKVVASDGTESTLFETYFRGYSQALAKMTIVARERIYDGTEEEAIANAIHELLSDKKVIESRVDVCHPPEDKNYFEIVKTFSVLVKGRFVIDE